MTRVRYAENSPNEYEVRYFIYIKGLKLGRFPQLKLQEMIEDLLNEVEEE